MDLEYCYFTRQDSSDKTQHELIRKNVPVSKIIPVTIEHAPAIYKRPNTKANRDHNQLEALAFNIQVFKFRNGDSFQVT